MRQHMLTDLRGSRAEVDAPIQDCGKLITRFNALNAECIVTQTHKLPVVSYASVKQQARRNRGSRLEMFA